MKTPPQIGASIQVCPNVTLGRFAPRTAVFSHPIKRILSGFGLLILIGLTCVSGDLQAQQLKPEKPKVLNESFSPKDLPNEAPLRRRIASLPVRLVRSVVSTLFPRKLKNGHMDSFETMTQVTRVVATTDVTREDGAVKSSRGIEGAIDSEPLAAVTDEEIVKLLSSRKQSDAAEAVDEIMQRGERMIPLLAKNKDNRGQFCGIEKLGHWGSGTVVMFVDNDRCRTSSKVTTEIASLFLINAIYYQDLEFAGPPVLCDRASDSFGQCRNDAKRIRTAWVSVDKWLAVYRRNGIITLRKSGQAPLSDSKVSFY